MTCELADDIPAPRFLSSALVFYARPESTLSSPTSEPAVETQPRRGFAPHQQKQPSQWLSCFVVSCENGQGLQHGDSRFYNVGSALPIATGYHTSLTHDTPAFSNWSTRSVFSLPTAASAADEILVFGPYQLIAFIRFERVREIVPMQTHQISPSQPQQLSIEGLFR